MLSGLLSLHLHTRGCHGRHDCACSLLPRHHYGPHGPKRSLPDLLRPRAGPGLPGSLRLHGALLQRFGPMPLPRHVRRRRCFQPTVFLIACSVGPTFLLVRGPGREARTLHHTAGVTRQMKMMLGLLPREPAFLEQPAGRVRHLPAHPSQRRLHVLVDFLVGPELQPGVARTQTFAVSGKLFLRSLAIKF